MKDYKLLLVVLIILLLVIFIAIFTWLWTNNRENTDPLPIMASENEFATVTNDEDTDTVSSSTLYIRAEENLQVPLDDIIVSFESRYPHMQVLASYVPSNALLRLSKNDITAHKGSDSTIDTDIIIANNGLSEEYLALLQAKLTLAKHKNNQSQPNTNAVTIDDGKNDNESSDNKKMTAESDNKEARTLNSFNYALRNKQALQGVILTDNTVAISFRNFLLSSTGQSILEKYDYYNIDGYKNSVNDLFKPTSQVKKASGDNPVDVADALSNGK